MRTDRPTDKLITVLRSVTGGEVIDRKLSAVFVLCRRALTTAWRSRHDDTRLMTVIGYQVSVVAS